MKTKKLFFTGIEIALGIALLALLGSGSKHYKDKRKMNNLAEQNEVQAVKIDKLVLTVQDTNKKKDDAESQHDQVQTDIKKKASEGFSVLYEQAVDVDAESQTSMTAEHLKTAQGYVEVWGYQAMAKVIKWQQDQIMANMRQTKELMEKEKKLREDYETLKVQTSQEIANTKKESEKHANDARSLTGEIKAFTAQNDWLDNVIFWICLGGGVYVFVSFGGMSLLAKARSNAMESAQHYRRKKNQMVKAVKTFNLVNPDGNDTMRNIIDASDDLDMEEEPEDESPVKTLKRKKQIPTKK